MVDKVKALSGRASRQRFRAFRLAIWSPLATETLLVRTTQVTYHEARSPVETVCKFIHFLSSEPPEPEAPYECVAGSPGSGRLVYFPTRPAGVHQPRWRLLCPQPAGMDEVTAALGDPNALKVWNQQLVPQAEAEELLQCSNILDRVDRGELFGLCIIPAGWDWREAWLFSRRRVNQLRTVDVIRRWVS